MANVHEIDIAGAMAFDTDGDKEVLRLLGWLSLPTIGFKIEWVDRFVVPNHHGGQTAMVRYWITGQEAVSGDAIRADVALLLRVGFVSYAKYRDVENVDVDRVTSWTHIKPDKPKFDPMDAKRCRFCNAAKAVKS